MDSDNNGDKRRAERIELITDVEFHTLKEMLEADSVDVSETGIRLKTSEPLKIKLRFKNNGILVEKLAQIVWAKTEEEGNASYGFEFYEPKKITPGSLPEDD